MMTTDEEEDYAMTQTCHTSPTDVLRRTKDRNRTDLNLQRP